MSETAPMRLPLVGDPRSAGLPPAFSGPQNFDETKVRLILAGESLFAEQSIENVSLREIARTANNGNNNAVQYHFGGKEGLIQAIFAYRVWQMDKVRREGLARLKSTGRDIDIQDLLDLLFMPLLDLADATGRHNYASVIVKYLLLSRLTGVPHAMDSLTESTAALREINSRIEGELAHLPADLVYNRIATASIMFNTMLVRSDNDGVTEAGGEQLRQRVGDCLEMIAAALLAPARAES